MWSEDDVDQVQQVAERVVGEPIPADDRDTLRRMLQACMTRTVELAAARGGTMTAATIEEHLEWVHGLFPEAVRDVRQHIAALGARNAVLEAELSRLKPSGQVAEDEYTLRKVLAWEDDTEAELAKSATALSRLASLAQRTQQAEEVCAKALADNAVLLSFARSVDARRHELFGAANIAELHMEHGRHRDALVDVLSKPGGPPLPEGPHPGAALLREAEALRARVKEVEEALAGAIRTGKQFEVAARKHFEQACINLNERNAVRAEVERLKMSLGNALAAGQVLSEHVDTMETRSPYERWPHPNRYPCSPTCTHDDAAKPGHPERVKERSESFIKEAGERFDGCKNDRERICYYAGWRLGVEHMEEAMRAACWEAVQEQLRACGFTEGMQAWRDFKAVIEGATP